MIAFLVPGCARDVYIPPARPFPLESAWTTPSGATRVQAETSLNTALLGPGVVGGGVRVSRGLTERVEVSVDTSLMHVTGASRAGVHPNIYAARVGAKLDLDLEGFAVTGGLGGGYAPAGGGFGSVDLGVVSALENCVLVPFGAGRLFASVPIWANSVELPAPAGASAEGQGPATRTYEPENTFGITANAGLRIPLDRQCVSRAGLLLGVGVTVLGDGDHGEIFTDAGIGFHVTFF